MTSVKPVAQFLQQRRRPLAQVGIAVIALEVEKALDITLPDIPRDISTVGALVALIEREVAKQREQTRE